MEKSTLKAHFKYFKANEIKTSKYNCLNFVPKNLFFQFTKMSNVYFLLMTFLQIIPEISTTGGQPTMAIPLGLMILISMVKDIIEDWKRKSQDSQENNRKVLGSFLG